MQKKLLVASILMAISCGAVAETTFDFKKSESLVKSDLFKVKENSRFYYQLGGSKPISEAPTQVTDLKLGGSLKAGLGYSCGKFDPTSGLKNFFNDLKSGVDDAVVAVQSAATSAISSLPMMALSRNSPDLYELLQTNVFRAEKKWSANFKSCQELESEIAQGKNPYKEWLPEASATKLAEEANSNPDISKAMKEVAKSGGDGGINFPVPGKGVTKAGGKGQPHIKPLTSALTAGYNIQIKRKDITSTNPPTSDAAKQSPMVQAFSSPKEMSKWAVEVLGEQDVVTSASESPSSEAGRGLLAKASEQAVVVRQDLDKIVANPRDSVSSEMLKVSTRSLVVTPELIRMLSDHPSKDMLSEVLSGEIALSQEIDKALIVRRSLLVGASEKNIASSGAAQKKVKEKVKQIESEIEQAMFEYRLRKELLSGVAEKILDNEGTEMAGSKLPSSGVNMNDISR